MSIWYVDSAAPGPTHDGSSWNNAWLSFATIVQSGLAGDDIIYVKSGTYDEKLTISKSGTSGHRITYLGSGATKPILRGVDCASSTDIAFINFEITQPTSSYNYPGFRFAGNSRWLIESCYIRDTYSYGIQSLTQTMSSFNIIRFNTWTNIAGTSGGVVGDTVIFIFGDSNLIEYNTIRLSLDRFRIFGFGNVCRNNYFGYTDTFLYPTASPYPFHTDGLQSFESNEVPLSKFLWEKNYDIDNSDSVGQTGSGPNGHMFIVQDQSTAGQNFNWYNVRFNAAIREADGAVIIARVHTGAFYNNTLVQVGVQHSTLFNNAVGFQLGVSGTKSNTWDFRNNTFPYCPKDIDAGGLILLNGAVTGFTSARNHSYNTGASQGVLPVGANPANISQIPPLFVNGSGVSGFDDYALTAASPLRGSGAAITTASGFGTGSTDLKVFDAMRLFDGWGIADSDIIKIGTGNFISISGINYTTNSITLSGASTWNSGDSVYVKGSQDIGAFPYPYSTGMQITNTTASNLPSGSVSLSATSSTPDSIRMIEFLVDSLPIGFSYTSPYQTTWTSDGAIHAIETRAYNMWTSPYLTLSDTITVNNGSGVPVYKRLGRRLKFKGLVYV